MFCPRNRVDYLRMWHKIIAGAQSKSAYDACTGAGYATQALSGFPETGVDGILKASLVTGESVLIFVTAAVALDYCLRVNVLGPFPLKKQP